MAINALNEVYLTEFNGKLYKLTKISEPEPEPEPE